MTVKGQRGGQFKHHQRLSAEGKGADTFDYVKTETGWNFRTDEPEEQDRSHLSMVVDQIPPKTAFAYPDTPAPAPTTDWGDQPSAADKDRMRAAQDDLHRSQPGNPHQSKLFGSVSTPGRSEVNYMLGTRQGRAHVMTMIGMAQIHNVQTHGRSLLPSSDLSPHSHKLTAHLAEKGASPEPLPVHNMMDFRSTGMPYRNMLSHDVPEAQVTQGRSFIRHVVRGGAADPRGVGNPHQFKKSRKPGPDQGTLF